MTTTVSRIRPVRNPPITPLPLSRSGSFRSRRAARSAGANPKIRAVNTATTSVKTITGAFSSMTDSAGIKFSGIAATINFNPPHAINTPSAAPPIANTRLSTSSNRTSLVRPAPSTARNANSFSRDVARASMRFATLPQPISSNNPTAARIVYSVDSNRPTTVSPNLLTNTWKCAG